MLLVAWFNWDKSKSSPKFSIQEATRDDYSQPGAMECEDPAMTKDCDFSINAKSTCETKDEVQCSGRVATTAKVVDGSGFKTVIGD